MPLKYGYHHHPTIHARFYIPNYIIVEYHYCYSIILSLGARAVYTCITNSVHPSNHPTIQPSNHPSNHPSHVDCCASRSSCFRYLKRFPMAFSILVRTLSRIVSSMGCCGGRSPGRTLCSWCDVVVLVVFVVVDDPNNDCSVDGVGVSFFFFLSTFDIVSSFSSEIGRAHV